MYIHISFCVPIYCIHSVSDWSTSTHDVDVRGFVEPVGPTSILPPTVLEMFQLFFTSAIVGMIVEQTNAYANEVLGDVAGDKWSDVTPEDIRAFLGFALLMEINRLPQLRLYWNANPVFHYLPIGEWITRDRFLDIWRFLHFVPSAPPPPPPPSGALSSSSYAGASSSSPADPTRTQDRLWKVRPIIFFVYCDVV